MTTSCGVEPCDVPGIAKGLSAGEVLLKDWQTAWPWRVERTLVGVSSRETPATTAWTRAKTNASSIILGERCADFLLASVEAELVQENPPYSSA
jgi:hypothetical protein